MNNPVYSVSDCCSNEWENANWISQKRPVQCRDVFCCVKCNWFDPEPQRLTSVSNIHQFFLLKCNKIQFADVRKQTSRKTGWRKIFQSLWKLICIFTLSAAVFSNWSGWFTNNWLTFVAILKHMPFEAVNFSLDLTGER